MHATSTASNLTASGVGAFVRPRSWAIVSNSASGVMPSFPDAPLPQARMRPSPSTAKDVATPAEAATTLLTPGTDRNTHGSPGWGELEHEGNQQTSDMVFSALRERSGTRDLVPFLNAEACDGEFTHPSGVAVRRWHPSSHFVGWDAGGAASRLV
jgi:hypothetical protein